MKIARNSIVLCLFSIGILFSASAAHAQLLPSDNPVSVEVSPSYPVPGQQVTVSVTASGFDINKADISWIIGGKTVLSGTGETSYSLYAGQNGSKTVVNIAIVPDPSADIQEIDKTVTIQPSEVDLLWDAHSYTPPFYEGKGLYPDQGQITVAAIPNFVKNGSIVDPSTLIYTWSQNGTNMGSLSGHGKDSITLQGSVLIQPLNISVTVTSEDGSFTGQGSATIVPQVPQILFYEDSQLYGTVYNSALPSALTLTDPEMRLRAAPYFFSTIEPHNDSFLSYDWQINGSDVSAANNGQSIITLRAPAGISGTSVIGATIKNSNYLLQSSQSTMSINFNTASQ